MEIFRHLQTFSKNDVISSVRKRYCALGLGLDLELEIGLWLALGLAETHFRLNVVIKKEFQHSLYLLNKVTFNSIYLQLQHNILLIKPHLTPHLHNKST